MKKIIITATVSLLFIGGIFFLAGGRQGTIKKSDAFPESVNTFKENAVSEIESGSIDLRLEGKSLSGFDYNVWIDDNLQIMASVEFLQDIIGCSVNEYLYGAITVERGNTIVRFEKDSNEAKVNDTAIKLISKVAYDDQGKFYIPVSQIIEYLDYKGTYSFSENAINFTKIADNPSLPTKYDMRERGRMTPVRDQGKYGTCWAFASLGALETTLMPMEKNIYSTDHMTLNNSYNLDLSLGGEHTMSIAYLAAWQGPVYEIDDPYGDGVTDDSLKAVKHLQEAIVINDRDDEVIKGAIYKYGGVETSLYLQMTYTGDYSKYYNEKTSAYYYNGKKRPNHDVVIVGWDDSFSKENFSVQPTSDGAFICKNSWGEDFGDGGYFYISYDDVNICNQSIVYSKLVEPDDFDKIYQSDLLGWVGQMGFGGESAYFANVYTAGKNEELAAASFYATDQGTTFSVYVVRDFQDESSLLNRTLVASGETRYAGYYTVKLNEPVKLDDYEKFAVVVYINTPGSERPIAIEYNVDARTSKVDLTDGEGYISLYGEAWHSAEETQDCNICLKAFTNNIDENEKQEEEPTDDKVIVGYNEKKE